MGTSFSQETRRGSAYVFYTYIHTYIHIYSTVVYTRHAPHALPLHRPVRRGKKASSTGQPASLARLRVQLASGSRTSISLSLFFSLYSLLGLWRRSGARPFSFSDWPLLSPPAQPCRACVPPPPSEFSIAPATGGLKRMTVQGMGSERLAQTACLLRRGHRTRRPEPGRVLGDLP